MRETAFERFSRAILVSALNATERAALATLGALMRVHFPYMGAHLSISSSNTSP
jgi:hypothetical protein